jgi:autotransporter adhesin
MKMMKTVLITSAILMSTPLWAQTGTVTPSSTASSNQSTTYGDNPNIFTVLGHKAQQKVQNTVEKVDTAAQKGIAKVKPKVENAWEGTKDFATEKSAIAKEKSQHAAATVNQKLNKTKDNIIGSPNDQPAPIISHPLSESSTNN